MTLTRKLQHNFVKDDVLAAGTAEPVASNGHAGSVVNGAAAAKRRGFLVARMLLLADWLGLVLAFVLADVILGSTGSPGDMSPLAELGVFAATLPLWTVAAKVYGLYDNDDERTDHSTADDLVGVFHLVTVGTWVLFVGSRVAGFAQPHLWRLVAFWALAIAMIALSRGLARAFCRRRITYLQNAHCRARRPAPPTAGGGDSGRFNGRMSNAPVRNRAKPRRRLAGTAVLAAGLVTAGLGTDGDRSSPNASDAAGPPPGPAAGAVRFIKQPHRARDLHAARAADPPHREAPRFACATDSAVRRVPGLGRFRGSALA
jgi:hypothetical protein